jgi:hypothetical protein
MAENDAKMSRKCVAGKKKHVTITVLQNLEINATSECH